MSNDSNYGCTGDTVRAERDPAYRRALWIVVILNLGFGAVEIVGGFIANSQALKADSLDFIGDGTITLAGLVAIGWTALARTRIALAQGLFLLSLGIGVIGVALWRALTAVPPEAELMGGIGAAALLVNLTSAAVLSRFRERRRQCPGGVAVQPQRRDRQRQQRSPPRPRRMDRASLARPCSRRHHCHAFPAFGL